MDIDHGCRKMFPLWRQGRIYPMLKQCAARLNAPNFMGAAAPIAPMVPTPMMTIPV